MNLYDSVLVAGCLDSRVAFDRARPHVSSDDLSPQAALFWPLIERWYDRDAAATGVDRALLRETAYRELPAAHRETLLGWYDALPSVPSPANAANALLELKRFNAQQELLAAVSTGSSTVTEAWDKYATLRAATDLQSSKTEPLFDVGAAYAFTRGDNLVPVAPAALNARLGGGLAPGDTVVVFARPEIGKTLFCVQQAVAAARAGFSVAYFGNEEPIARTVQRAVSSFVNRTTDQCAAHAGEALDVARRRGLDLIAFRHLDPGTTADIERGVRATRPHLVIVDQIRNIMHKGDAAHVRMEEVQKQIRAMASRYEFAAISVTQAGDSGEGKTFLTMGDVDNSNTGVPGACDVMIGIGAAESMKDTPRRGLSLPKNKIGHTHEGMMVSFDAARNRIT